ncbi:unnamed protein product [Cylindrotheca closterium]|uniref:Uncharacterized protein n=1 Tax=Cylindrotheca closterium TaxID=2856 RepID=A0AAD2CI87_9STRA|nr:unnamed protein product [Cylindrotheca closterium]
MPSKILPEGAKNIMAAANRQLAQNTADSGFESWKLSIEKHSNKNNISNANSNCWHSKLEGLLDTFLHTPIWESNRKTAMAVSKPQRKEAPRLSARSSNFRECKLEGAFLFFLHSIANDAISPNLDQRC